MKIIQLKNKWIDDVFITRLLKMEIIRSSWIKYLRSFCNNSAINVGKKVDFTNPNSLIRASVQGVKSLGGHFACLCRGFEFYEVKKKQDRRYSDPKARNG